MKTQDRDVKKRRRAALSKMAILLAFTVLVWLFLTMHMQIKQMTAETA